MTEPYVPRSPDLSALHASSTNSNSHPHPPSSHPYPQTQQQYPSQSNPSAYQYNSVPTPPLYKQPSDSYQPQQHLSNFHLPPSNAPAWSHPQHQQHYTPQPVQDHYQPYSMARTRKHPDPDAAYDPQHDPYNYPPASSNSFAPKHPSQQLTPSHSEPPPKAPPGQAENIQVKTKFPVARIKRIVQADEDVGKVAQSTPVAVSKALELFMISLALGSAQIARERGSKKVTGACLKQVVGKDEQFDFLREMVAKIPDSSGGTGAAASKKRESASEEPVSDGEEAALKRRRKARARKKSESDSD